MKRLDTRFGNGTRIAISMGDPAGIGPEAVLKALVNPALRRRIRPLLVGDLGVFRDTARRLKLQIEFVAKKPGVPMRRGSVPVCEVSALLARDRLPGRPRPAGGEAAYRAIIAAVEAVRSGEAAAMVTAPISKANLTAAGHDIGGHTELLRQLGGVPQVRMMMAGPQLRVVLATTHVALRRVPALLTPGLILDTIGITQQALRRLFGVEQPRLAVCGLNPHAGESGLFGREEERAIRPAVRAARRRGIQAVGPLAADSVFAQTLGGQYDAVVCMYHDQGLAPFKLLHFRDGVNVTLGLPFVRTSPDHGTAFDIAGTGMADPASTVAAAELAARLARRIAPWARMRRNR